MVRTPRPPRRDRRGAPPRRLAVIATTFLSALTATAGAQSRLVLSPFASRNSSLEGSPFLMGASLTTYGSKLGGVVGMRVGGAYDLRALGGSSADAVTDRGWVADVDGVISPARLPVIGPLLGGFLPTVFSGIGVEGIRRADGTGGQSVVTSYGATVARSIGSSFTIETEARRRVPVSWTGGTSSEAAPITQRGWEYRLGFSIGFGGSAAPRGGVPSLPIPIGGAATRDRTPTAIGTAELASADDFLGTRYLYGGSSPRDGFDCSGFVQYVFARNGVRLPRTSRQQSGVGRALTTSLDGLTRGDLLFFSQNGEVVDHVAIYAGDGRIVHSSSSGGGVRYDDLRTSRGQWFARRLVAVRRVLGEGAAFASGSAATQLMPGADLPDKAPIP